MRGWLKTAADIFAVFRLHGAKMRVLRSENRVSGAKFRRVYDDAFVRKSCIGKCTLGAVLCASAFCRCTAMRAYSATCGEMRGKRADIGDGGKNCVGEDMRGKGRYRRGRARDVGMRGGKTAKIGRYRERALSNVQGALYFV